MSESAKHTPGPWCVVAETAIWAGNGEWRDRPLLKCDLMLRSWARELPYAEHLANARIAAAAPDLYEALTKLCDQCEAEFTTDGKWDRQGQLVTEHAYKRARAALLRAQASEQSGG